MKPIRSDREFEQMQRLVVTEATASRAPSIMRTSLAQALVDQFLRLIDQRHLEGDGGDFLDPEQDVLEGQAGIKLRDLLCSDLVAGGCDQLRLDAGSDDLAVDERAVEIENDEVWLGHDFPGTPWAEGGEFKRRALHHGSLSANSPQNYRPLLH